MGVYGSPYGIYGMNYNLGTSYQGKIGANGIAFSNGVTNGFVSDPVDGDLMIILITMHRDQN